MTLVITLIRHCKILYSYWLRHIVKESTHRNNFGVDVLQHLEEMIKLPYKALNQVMEPHLKVSMESFNVTVNLVW